MVVFPSTTIHYRFLRKDNQVVFLALLQYIVEDLQFSSMGYHSEEKLKHMFGLQISTKSANNELLGRKFSLYYHITTQLDSTLFSFITAAITMTKTIFLSMKTKQQCLIFYFLDSKRRALLWEGQWFAFLTCTDCSRFFRKQSKDKPLLKILDC